MKRKDLTNMSFGNLKAISYIRTDKYGHAIWLCECQNCGSRKEVFGKHLLDGSTRSCGCLHHNYGHHMTDTRIYAIWCTMKARCNRPNSHKYQSYGGRGITVCEEWQEFLPFYEWAMANGYCENLTIDRIDNNGDYCPENCRWVTRKAQANNTRRNCVIEFNEEIHTLKEWSEITGISYSTLLHRKARGWSTEKILAAPKRRY